VLLLHALALLLVVFFGLVGLLLTLASQAGSVVTLVPSPEWCGINLDHGSFRQGVGSDEFVVGRMVDDTNHTSLAADALGAPGEIAGIETKGAELAISTASTDEMDTFGADTGVGGLTALLESTVKRSISL
jgi:hypothetical protein